MKTKNTIKSMPNVSWHQSDDKIFNANNNPQAAKNTDEQMKAIT